MGIATAAIPWIPHGYDISLHYLQLYAMLVQCGIGVVKYKLPMPLLVTSWALAAMCTFYSACEGAVPNISRFPDMSELIITGTKRYHVPGLGVSNAA